MAKSKPSPSAPGTPAGAVHIADRVRMALGTLPPDEADGILKLFNSGAAMRRKARDASRAGLAGRFRLVRVARDLTAVIQVGGTRVDVIDLVSSKLLPPARPRKATPARPRKAAPRGKPTRV